MRSLLPGEDLVERGIRDLEREIASAEALQVSLAAPRLRALGLDVPAPLPDPELRLYQLLAEHSTATRRTPGTTRSSVA